MQNIILYLYILPGITANILYLNRHIVGGLDVLPHTCAATLKYNNQTYLPDVPTGFRYIINFIKNIGSKSHQLHIG